MTISFPKFPNKRQPHPAKNPQNPQESNHQAVTQNAPLSASDETSLHATTTPADTKRLPEAEIAELKATLIAQQPSKPAKNKRLPLLVGAGVVLLGALGAVGYPMYQTMMEERTAAATPVVKPSTPVQTSKPSSSVTPTAPATVGTIAQANPNTATNPTPASSLTTTVVEEKNQPSEANKAKEDNLDKPLLADRVSTDSAKPTPASNSQPSLSTSEPSPKSDTKSEVPKNEVSKAHNDIPVTSDTKPATGKNAMSYDEFVKTSDSSVFIEAPPRHK